MHELTVRVTDMIFMGAGRDVIPHVSAAPSFRIILAVQHTALQYCHVKEEKPPNRMMTKTIVREELVSCIHTSYLLFVVGFSARTCSNNMLLFNFLPVLQLDGWRKTAAVDSEGTANSKSSKPLRWGKERCKIFCIAAGHAHIQIIFAPLLAMLSLWKQRYLSPQTMHIFISSAENSWQT